MTRYSYALATLAFLTLAACCGTESPLAPAPVASTPVEAPALGAYVTNENSGDLSVIDVQTNLVVATVPLGKRPRGIAVSPDGETLYVALSGSPAAPPGVDESTLPSPDRTRGWHRRRRCAPTEARESAPERDGP